MFYHRWRLDFDSIRVAESRRYSWSCSSRSCTRQIYRLAVEIITGFLAQRDLCSRANNDQLQHRQTRQVAQLNAIIERGERAKQTLKEFFNDFVCADLSIPFGQWVSPRQRQPPNNSVPMTIGYPSVVDHELDYTDLVFTFEKHICADRKCLKLFNNQRTCKYGFPKPGCHETIIEVKVDTRRSFILFFHCEEPDLVLSLHSGRNGV